MKEYAETLRAKLAQYGLRPLDVVFVLFISVTLAMLLMVMVSSKRSERMLKQEIASLRSELGLDEDEITLITEAPQTETVLPSETVPETQLESTEEITEPAANMLDSWTTPEILQQVDSVMAKMTLEEKIYQLFIVTPEVLVNNQYTEVSAMDSVVSDALYAHPVGGVVFFAQNLKSLDQITRLISGMQGCTGNVGMWVSVDEEGGKVARCAQNLGTPVYSAMQVYGARGDTDEIYRVGEGIAADISQFGFNLDFAPVADVNLNAGNELGDRIFSSDPQVVSSMTGAMVRGLQSSGKVSATLKHFPGLGAAGGNTHTDNAAHISRTYQQLESDEFAAFRGGIQAGVDFVMVGHQIMDCAGDNLPSDLSPTVVTGWLRGELEFQGIVVTDAQNMNTITQNYSAGEAAKRSLQAGVDMVLMPTDLNDAYNTVYNAVQNQEITESRIDESVRRILIIKAKHGLLNP